PAGDEQQLRLAAAAAFVVQPQPIELSVRHRAAIVSRSAQKIQWTGKYSAAATRPAAGIVSSQANTMLPATPQRTADRRRVAPAPMTEPVTTCVVEIGKPK